MSKSLDLMIQVFVDMIMTGLSQSPHAGCACIRQQRHLDKMYSIVSTISRDRFIVTSWYFTVEDLLFRSWNRQNRRCRVLAIRLPRPR